MVRNQILQRHRDRLRRGAQVVQGHVRRRRQGGDEPQGDSQAPHRASALVAAGAHDRVR